MTENAVRVSVLMSVYNGEQFLPSAIMSILTQEGVEFELIVTNDGSTDKSGMIVDHFARLDPRVRVIHQENRGLTYSLNHMLSLSRGEFVARLDADDVAYPGRLAQQVAYLTARPEVGLVGTWTNYVGAVGESYFVVCLPDDDGVIKHALNVGVNPFVHSSVMYRRELLLQLGITYRNFLSEDYDLWLRLVPYTQFGMVESVLTAYRSHSANVTKHNLERREKTVALIETLHRKRQAGQPEGDWEAQLNEIMSTDASASHLENRHPLVNRSTVRNWYRLFYSTIFRHKRVEKLTFWSLRLLPTPAFRWVWSRLSPKGVYYRPIQRVANVRELQKTWQDLHSHTPLNFS